MQNRQRNVGQSKLSKVIFVATNASRENNKVRASERRQPLTVEQMSAEQERYGNQTSDVRIHVWQRIRFARWSNTTGNRPKRTLRKPASINESKNCKTYLPDTSSDLRIGETSLTRRAGKVHYYMVAWEIPVHWRLALGAHCASKAATSSRGLWLGRRDNYSLDAAPNRRYFRWQNVGAANSYRNTGSASETYPWCWCSDTVGVACGLYVRWTASISISLLLHACALGLLSSQIIEPATLHLSCLMYVSL